MKTRCLIGILMVMIGRVFGGSVEGNREEVMKKFEGYVQEYFEKSKVPGMGIAVVSLDKVYLEKYFGVREVGKKEKVDEKTVFLIGSCTKAFTSGVIAYLVGKGMLSWDDRVVDFEPGFVLKDAYVTCEMKVRDLLCHRSGLPTEAGEELAYFFKYEKEEVLRRIRYLGFIHDFRTVFGYQNFLVAIGGDVAGHAAKTSWKELVQKSIFEPLGMKRSFACYNDLMKEPNRVSSHSVDMKGKDKFIVKPTYNLNELGAAGVISSTIRDMTAWVRLQMGKGFYQGKEVIFSEALKETHKVQIVMDQTENAINGIGLGWVVTFMNNTYMLHHEGCVENGSYSLVCILPEKNLGLVILTNSGPCGLVSALKEKFLELVLTGKDEKDAWGEALKKIEENNSKEKRPFYEEKPKNFTPSLALEAYEGEYENDYYGKIKIEIKDKTLTAHFGNNEKANPLYHWNRDIFYDKEFKQEVTFVVENQEKAEKVIFSLFCQDGRNGTFVRVKK